MERILTSSRSKRSSIPVLAPLPQSFSSVDLLVTPDLSGTVSRKCYESPQMRVYQVEPACMIAESGRLARQEMDEAHRCDSLPKDTFWVE